jgi:hypothetical protein
MNTLTDLTKLIDVAHDAQQTKVQEQNKDLFSAAQAPANSNKDIKELKKNVKQNELMIEKVF